MKKALCIAAWAFLIFVGLIGDAGMDLILDKIQSLPVVYWEGLIYAVVFVLGMCLVMTYVEKSDRQTRKREFPVVSRKQTITEPVTVTSNLDKASEPGTGLSLTR